MNTEKDYLSKLHKLLPGQKLYIEVEEHSYTYRMFFAKFVRKGDGVIPYENVKCVGYQEKRLVDAGWSLINRIDKVARLVTEFAGKLDFVIWGREELDQPARVVRRYGTYLREHDEKRLPELEEGSRKAGIIL